LILVDDNDHAEFALQLNTISKNAGYKTGNIIKLVRNCIGIIPGDNNAGEKQESFHSAIIGVRVIPEDSEDER
jgi:hypothetical protein